MTGREDFKSSRKPQELAHNISHKDWMDGKDDVAWYVADEVAVR